MYNLDLTAKNRAVSELQQYAVIKIVPSTAFYACRIQELQDGRTGCPILTFPTIITTTLPLKTLPACVSSPLGTTITQFHNLCQIPGYVIKFPPPPFCYNGS